MTANRMGPVACWWTVAEVAEHLGLTEEETRRQVIHGPLNGSYIGGELKIYEPDLSLVVVCQ